MISLAPISFVAVACLVGCLLSREKRPRAICLFSIIGLWGSYVVFIGGDTFPAWRHLIPLIVVFIFALIEGLQPIWKQLDRRSGPAFRFLTYALLILMFFPYVYIQLNHPQRRTTVFYNRWVWNGKAVGIFMKKAFAEQKPLLAVTAAGCLPYWSGLPSLDMLGLNDYYLPRHPPADFGTGRLGHELGEGAYVLGRKPDIICFHVGDLNAYDRSGREMQETRQFYDEYTPVRIRGTVPHEYIATLWILKYSDKIGIRRTPIEVTVPGFLLNAGPKTIAYLNDRDVPVVSVSAGRPASVVLPTSAYEDWDIEVKSPHPEKIKTHRKCIGDSVQIMLTSEASEPIEVEELVLRKNIPSSVKFQGADAIEVSS